ncbi:IQ-domain 20 [Forsythia ovata]|uniref:IQ-domain 20 n=1 Tax=Forsythia ovata TaxID=205694 RepID=A0ABD1WNI1_9LAMI
MGIPRNNWFGFGIVRRKLSRPSPRETGIVLDTNNTSTGSYDEAKTGSSSECNMNAGSDFFSREDLAATTIQAFFRGHLAKRAFRALKSLIKLQAVVRGMLVRRQARIALHCMHALARLQITIRARQLLSYNE